MDKSRDVDMFTTGQAARLSGVKPDTVLKWIKRGRLAASRTAGGHYRIALPDLEPFLARFGQRTGDPEDAAAPSGETATAPAGAEDPDAPCWVFLSEEGEIREACRRCIVYRVRATRCFLMAEMNADVGHARQFCEGSCDDCLYYRRLRQRRVQVLVITSDEELMSHVAGADALVIRFARNGYEAATVVERFRPEVIVLDVEGFPDWGRGLLDSLAGDPRLLHAKVILVGSAGAERCVARGTPHRMVTGIFEKPHVCGRLAQIVRGSLEEPGPPGKRMA